jgi:uncharacterized protein YcaQ
VIQAYTPAAKRQYGYFPLPCLHNGALIGRVDAKAHRKEALFEVKGFYLEDGLTLTDEMARAVVAALLDCAKWHRIPTVVISDAVPLAHRQLLSKYL